VSTVKVGIENGRMYLNNTHFCLVEAGNGRDCILSGSYELSSQFSHSHGRVLPKADGAGWIGADAGCDIILGGVRGRTCIIPNPSFVDALLVKLEVAEGLGKYVLLEVK